MPASQQALGRRQVLREQARCFRNLAAIEQQLPKIALAGRSLTVFVSEDSRSESAS